MDARQPYDPAASIPGDVDPAGWRAVDSTRMLQETDD